MNDNKVAIYCRLSVEDYGKLKDGDDSESIQNQKLLLMDYSLNQGWSIHKVYSDDDYSGLDKDRPEFNQMIVDAKAGLFNIILCKHQSRFTREMEMVEKYIHGLFVLWGIRFVSVIDHVDTNVKGNKKARQINGLINEWYCEDLSENIRAVFRQKMQSGQFLGAFASYGYLKDPHDRHKLCIDEEAAKVVREIYHLYLQGYGYHHIAGTLTERGILTPSAYKANQGLNFANPNSKKYSERYGIWAVNTVSRILRNKVYIGCLIQGREKKVSYKSKKVITTPQEDWVIIEKNHEPIISEKDFYIVQGLISRKRTVHKPRNGYKGAESAYILAGKLKCMDCGSNMQKAAPTRDGSTFYLRCSLANKTKSQECTPHSVKLNVILEAVDDRIRKLINSYFENENDMTALKDYFSKKTVLKDQLSRGKLEVAEIETKIKEIARMLTTAYMDKAKGIIGEDDFIAISGVFDEDKKKLLAQKAHLEEKLKAMEISYLSTNNLDLLIRKYAKFSELTHEIINDFIDTIEVGNDKILINWLF